MNNLANMVESAEWQTQEQEKKINQAVPFFNEGQNILISSI